MAVPAMRQPAKKRQGNESHRLDLREAPWSAAAAATALECGRGSERRDIQQQLPPPTTRKFRSSPRKGGSFAAALQGASRTQLA
jgi:hypothetical protein